MVEKREGPARRAGVSLPGVAVALMLSSGAILLAAALVSRVWRADLTPLFVLAGFPLVLCAVSLLTSDVWFTHEEKLDRHLGLSFRGERRDAARAAYADLWRESQNPLDTLELWEGPAMEHRAWQGLVKAAAWLLSSVLGLAAVTVFLAIKGYAVQQMPLPVVMLTVLLSITFAFAMNNTLQAALEVGDVRWWRRKGMRRLGA